MRDKNRRDRKVLILGGTGEAVNLATDLLAAGFEVTTSLAGVTAAPRLAEGQCRTGGFKGVAGLTAYLREGAFSMLVDATHPFAAAMSRHAHEAAASLSLPLLRLERPAWQPQEGDKWILASSLEEAASLIPAGACPFITTGHKGLSRFAAAPYNKAVVRLIEAPKIVWPAGWVLLRARPPFDVADETILMRGHMITHLVTKNSGGSATAAKLEAARGLSLPVIMIVRPYKPEAPLVSRTDDAVAAVTRLLT